MTEQGQYEPYYSVFPEMSAYSRFSKLSSRNLNDSKVTKLAIQ